MASFFSSLLFFFLSTPSTGVCALTGWHSTTVVLNSRRYESSWHSARSPGIVAMSARAETVAEAGCAAEENSDERDGGVVCEVCEQ